MFSRTPVCSDLYRSLGFENPLGPCSPPRELHAGSAAAKPAAPLRKDGVCRGLARYESNQTTYNTTFLRYELSRLEFFPPTSPFVMCFELHFSGSTLSTLADCLTKFGSQPPWPRCPALARYIASINFLRQPWAANRQRRRVFATGGISRLVPRSYGRK